MEIPVLPPNFRLEKNVNGKLCENCIHMKEEGRIAMRCTLYDLRVDWQNVCDSWKTDGTPVWPDTPQKPFRKWAK